MSGEQECENCELCGKWKPIKRKYYHYDVDCYCHTPNHFEIVKHCKDCVPKEPTETKIWFKTIDLKKLEE